MIFSILQKISLVPSYIWDAIWAPVYKKCMKHCGKGVFLRPMFSDIKGLWNLSVGDGTSIPKGSTIYCTDAPCTIGKKVIFGPRPTIITGDHRIDVIGKHLIDVTVEEKYINGENPYDQPVVIEDGCWIGARAVVGPGVIVNKNTILTLGSVATKNLDCDSVYQGVPAVCIRKRTLS